jgi:outer membrane protein OmpU
MEKHNMKNKLTKIGVSALCGSLAAISAQAGEMSVSGTATATWTKGSQSTNGNPLGMNSGLTFKGTGELDNGTAVTYTLTHADKATYSVGSIALATPGMGTFSISHASGGNGIGGYDDKMPTAWEETWGNAIATSVNLQKGVGSSMNMQWASPSIGNTTVKVAFAPRNDGGQTNDKATSGGANSGMGHGVDIVIDSTPIEGFNLWIGGSRTDRPSLANGPLEDREDHHEANIGGVFSLGPVSIGAAKAVEFTGNPTSGSVEYYNNTMYGVSFNVSDDLSLSAARLTSQKKVAQTFTPQMEVTSFQAAYSMGGASFKLAKTDSDNTAYSNATSAQKDAWIMAMTLAF